MEGGGSKDRAAEARVQKLEEAANVAIPLVDSLPVLAASRDALLQAVEGNGPTLAMMNGTAGAQTPHPVSTPAEHGASGLLE